MNVETLLGPEAQRALAPRRTIEHAQIGEKGAEANGLWTGNRDVVCRPWVRRNLVLAPAGVAAGARLHLQDDEVGEAALQQTPAGTEAGDTAADDDDRAAREPASRPDVQPRPQPMPSCPAIVHERSRRRAPALAREADERRTCTEEHSARDRASHVTLIRPQGPGLGPQAWPSLTAPGSRAIPDSLREPDS